MEGRGRKHEPCQACECVQGQSPGRKPPWSPSLSFWGGGVGRGRARAPAVLGCPGLCLEALSLRVLGGKGGCVEVGVHAHCVGLSFPPNNVERFVYPPQPLHPFPLRAIYNALNSIAPGTQRQRGTMTWEETKWFHLSSTPSIKTTDWLADFLQAPPHPIHTMVTPGLEKTLPRIVSRAEQMCPGAQIQRLATLHTPFPQASPRRLTGWGRCAVAANWELMLEAGESAWWGESTQHRGEEEGVGGYWVPIEVPAPRCRAGTAIASHAKRPQSEGQADSLTGSCDGFHAVSLPRGMRPGPRGGLGGQPTPTPFCPWSSSPKLVNFSLLEPPP